jgi:hypothetical protein
VADLAGLFVTDPAFRRFLGMTERQSPPAQPAARDKKPVPQSPKDEAAACEAAKLADKVHANA